MELNITASYERFCHIPSQTLMTAFIHPVTGLLRVQHLMSLYSFDDFDTSFRRVMFHIQPQVLDRIDVGTVP